jgi:Icc-related predicted phosphoesterase
MKLLILADIDDLHWQHGKGKADVILSCGDIHDQVILEAAQAYGRPPVFAVKGNNDTNAPFAVPIMDLHLQHREYGGLRFGGLNGSWRYNPQGHFLYEQAEAEALLEDFPPVDVFIAHNSPRGIHDRDDGVHFGFEALNTYIILANPKLVIHGHQHIDMESQAGGARVIGVYGHRVIEL